MTIAVHTDQDYGTALLSLLPQGIIWQRDPESVQGQVMLALAPTFQRLEARGANLLVDAFPATTAELLPEWELSLGLPDSCAGDLQTIQQRVAAVVAKLTETGGQSVPYFIALAANLGIVIEIQEFTPLVSGFNSGDYLLGDDSAYHWQVTAYAQQTVYYFEAGSSYSGDYLTTYAPNVLECVFNKLKPGHTTISFQYAFLLGDGVGDVLSVGSTLLAFG